MLLATQAQAATTINMVVNTITPVYDSNQVVGAPLDAAPGFATGSLASDGIAKTDIYFSPTMLFDGPITLGDIKSIRYWTKKGTTHAASAPDWFLTIYTEPYAGDLSSASWYGDRIGSEPYFSSAIADPAMTWNQWTTDGASNRLRFFESTAGAPGASFGSYDDPDWDTFIAANALSGDPYAGHSLLLFSIQTGSNWAAGFTGQLDGLRIELTDGSVATVNFEATCLADADCEVDGLYCTYDNCHTADGICISQPRDCAASTNPTTFEAPTFTLGVIDGQDGWSSSGAAGGGCAVYDHEVDDSLGTSGFGAQSLRISNAVTSTCYTDQTFSRSLTNEVGETDAANGDLSGGSRRTHFESQFDIASAVPGAEQPGLVLSTSAARGDTVRMTFLRFEDSPTGLQLYFDDYRDVAPFGTVGNEIDGCSGSDDFLETQIGIDLDRSVPHTILETLDVIDGPANDVVTVSIDGQLVHTGTSWEDYFRWCEATGVSRTVDSRLFRTHGTAAPATAGFGFLIDNFTDTSGTTEGSICGDTCNEADDTCLTPTGETCTDDANPCTVDQCDGSGGCTHTPGNAASVCRASVGACDLAETCDGISALCPDDGLADSSTVCRGSAGVCDQEETCTGDAVDCPADAKSMAVCRGAMGVCDAAETCDGVSDECPIDAFAAPATLCRASAGACDVAESCTGAEVDCPTDGFAMASSPCPDDANMCTTDICDGAGTCTHPVTPGCSETELHLTLVRVKQQRSGNGRGSVRLQGTFLTSPPADVFDDSAPISLVVVDSLTLHQAQTWSTAECRTSSNGKVKCSSEDKSAKARFLPVKGEPGTVFVDARLRRRAIDAPQSAPVSVTLEYGAGPENRAGSISDCKQTNSALLCRPSY